MKNQVETFAKISVNDIHLSPITCTVSCPTVEGTICLWSAHANCSQPLYCPSCSWMHISGGFAPQASQGLKWDLEFVRSSFLSFLTNDIIFICFQLSQIFPEYFDNSKMIVALQWHWSAPSDLLGAPHLVQLSGELVKLKSWTRMQKITSDWVFLTRPTFMNLPYDLRLHDIALPKLYLFHPVNKFQFLFFYWYSSKLPLLDLLCRCRINFQVSDMWNSSANVSQKFCISSSTSQRSCTLANKINHS